MAHSQLIWASLIAQLVKNLPAMQEMRVQSLGQEDPLEKKMATHSSTLAWKILWTEEPGGLQSPSAVILEPKKIKSVTVSPSICHEVMGP